MTAHVRKFMGRALDLARQAAAAGEVPIAAIVTRNGEVVAEAHNSPITDHDPTAHAEVLAIRRAAQSLGADVGPIGEMFARRVFRHHAAERTVDGGAPLQ